LLRTASEGGEDSQSTNNAEQLEKALQEIKSLQEQLSSEREHSSQFKVVNASMRPDFSFMYRM
jgi:uncharacterized protein YigA (DUF484 family)